MIGIWSEDDWPLPGDTVKQTNKQTNKKQINKWQAQDKENNNSPSPGGGGWGYGFQVTRKIEYGQKSKPPKKSLDQKFTSKKSHDEFPSLKNFQEALNDILTTFETPKSICCFNNNTMQNDNSKQDYPGFVLWNRCNVMR